MRIVNHKSHDELNRELQVATKQVVIGGIYRHYKYPERKYFVEMLAIQEASLKVCVIYKDIAAVGAPSFVRDLGSWLETVDWEGEQVPRFIILGQTLA